MHIGSRRCCLPVQDRRQCTGKASPGRDLGLNLAGRLVRSGSGSHERADPGTEGAPCHDEH